MPACGVQGGISDAWQLVIPETEAPGKYLLLAPREAVADDVVGYKVRHSRTFNIFLGVRLTDPDIAWKKMSRGSMGSRWITSSSRSQYSIPRGGRPLHAFVPASNRRIGQNAQPIGLTAVA